MWRGFVGRLPPEIRTKLARAIAAQRAALAALRPHRAPDTLVAVPRCVDAVPQRYVLADDPASDLALHGALLRLWRRVRSDPSAPCLVLVTPRDGMSSDFIQQLVNCDFLDGHFVVIDRAACDNLVALERNCLFSLTTQAGEPADTPRMVRFDPHNVTTAHAYIVAKLHP
jgi:hypothetical protein